jgi:RNA polymerase sigma factor (TIGR02999 family)
MPHAVNPDADATVASLIAAADRGDAPARQAVFSQLYDDLHRVARRELRRRGMGMTLGATTLLHEAYLDIAGREGVTFLDEGRFIGYAARVMRGVIVDYARRRQAQKRGGLFELTSLATDVAEPDIDDRHLTRLSDALDELAAVDPALSEIVDLKFFCGFSWDDIRKMRGVSEKTVRRQWDKARVYLHAAMQDTTFLE